MRRVRTYYLRDEDHNGEMRRITLQEIEAERNQGLPEELYYHIRCFADVYGADCGRVYAAIGYTLLYRENGKFHLVDPYWPAEGTPSEDEINKQAPKHIKRKWDN